MMEKLNMLRGFEHTKVYKKLAKFGLDTTKWRAPEEVKNIRMMPQEDIPRASPENLGRALAHVSADKALWEQFETWIRNQSDYVEGEPWKAKPHHIQKLKQIWDAAYIEAEKKRYARTDSDRKRIKKIRNAEKLLEENE